MQLEAWPVRSICHVLIPTVLVQRVVDCRTLRRTSSATKTALEIRKYLWESATYAQIPGCGLRDTLMNYPLGGTTYPKCFAAVPYECLCLNLYAWAPHAHCCTVVMYDCPNYVLVSYFLCRYSGKVVVLFASWAGVVERQKRPTVYMLYTSSAECCI